MVKLILTQRLSRAAHIDTAGTITGGLMERDEEVG